MKICVVGDGSWGTALAQVLADAGCHVEILTRQRGSADHINVHHSNARYLKDSILSENIHATDSRDEAFDDADACLFVTPSKYIRQTAEKLAEHIDDALPIINCSKGIEDGSGSLPNEVLESVLGNAFRIAVLSGPTHAEEVIRKVPSGAVIASVSQDCSLFFRDLFSTDYFRTYTSNDIVGVELCAAFKNVIAIAVGISYGIGLGDNTAAMIMTRGLAEMSRMVCACGGNALTCLGLAGAGDMIVTCTSIHSRNRRFGQDYIAKGLTLGDFEKDTHMVVEGAQACKTLETLSLKHGVELPLTDAVKEVIWNGADPKLVAKELTERSLKDEFYGII